MAMQQVSREAQNAFYAGLDIYHNNVVAEYKSDGYRVDLEYRECRSYGKLVGKSKLYCDTPELNQYWIDKEAV